MSNPDILELARIIERSMKQRSRLDGILAEQGYSDEAKASELGIVNAACRCRFLIDQLLRFDDLPHRANPALEHSLFFRAPDGTPDVEQGEPPF